MLRSILEDTTTTGKVRMNSEIDSLIDIESAIIKDVNDQEYKDSLTESFKAIKISIARAQKRTSKEKNTILSRIKRELYILLLNYVYKTDQVEVMKIMNTFHSQMMANTDENYTALCNRCRTDCIKGEIFCGSCILDIGYMFLYKKLMNEEKRLTQIVYDVLLSPYYADIPTGRGKITFVCKSCHNSVDIEGTTHPIICLKCVQTKTPYIILIAELEGIIKRKDM